MNLIRIVRDSQIDWIIYRYADVLTLTAEAIVRNKNAVTQEAVNLLNEVRTRSLPGKGYSLQDLNSVDKFLKAVLDERRLNQWVNKRLWMKTVTASLFHKILLMKVRE